MNDFVTINSVDYREGDVVVVRKGSVLTFGVIKEVDNSSSTIYPGVGLATGGWFYSNSGQYIIGGVDWQIIRKATREDIATLDVY